MDEQQLEAVARDVIASWNAWCDAPGWDNNEYDPLCDNLTRLEHLLRAKDATVENEGKEQCEEQLTIGY